MKDYIFTSESVSEGHPDKVCDQVSDAVLDAYLKEDPESRVACETLVKNNLVVIAGEITSKGNPDLESVVRKVINENSFDKTGTLMLNCRLVLTERFAENTGKLFSFFVNKNKTILTPKKSLPQKC